MLYIDYPQFTILNIELVSRMTPCVTAQGFRGPMHVAELDAPMFAAGNASECLNQGSCLPLGGHSVWAALPPLPVSGGDKRQVVLIAAGIDSTAFFHDRAKVCDSDPYHNAATVLNERKAGNARILLAATRIWTCQHIPMCFQFIRISYCEEH